jgi:hypothetical protein
MLIGFSSNYIRDA